LAMPTPIAAMPAPMTLAASRLSMMNSLVNPGGLVKVDRVVDVERRQDRENIGLDRADQQLERHHRGDEDERQQADQDPAAADVDPLDDEVREHLDQNVAGDHRHEES